VLDIGYSSSSYLDIGYSSFFIYKGITHGH
jgi:hypothetical protein